MSAFEKYKAEMPERVEELEAENQALKLNIEYYREQLSEIQAILGRRCAEDFIRAKSAQLGSSG